MRKSGAASIQPRYTTAPSFHASCEELTTTSASPGMPGTSDCSGSDAVPQSSAASCEARSVTAPASAGMRDTSDRPACDVTPKCGAASCEARSMTATSVQASCEA